IYSAAFPDEDLIPLLQDLSVCGEFDGVWSAFMPTARSITSISRHDGAEAALTAYGHAVDGELNPSESVILAFD
ncbi:MAG: hypothetical protein AAGL49_09925, partial [Pseudomonadota bacterium]